MLKFGFGFGKKNNKKDGIILKKDEVINTLYIRNINIKYIFIYNNCN